MAKKHCLLLIGPMCSGKTSLANALHESGFVHKKSNIYSIEENRRTFGNGLMSGEMFAWANFLQEIEQPPIDDNSIYEFSGTGKNVFNVTMAMKHCDLVDWTVVYCLAPDAVILKRFPNKVYDAPMPYTLEDPAKSLSYMNEELKKLYQNEWSWNKSRKLKFNMDVENYDGIVSQIQNSFL